MISDKLGIETLGLEKIDKVIGVESIREGLSGGLFLIDAWDDQRLGSTVPLIEEAITAISEQKYGFSVRIDLDKSVDLQIESYLNHFSPGSIKEINIYVTSGEFRDTLLDNVCQISNTFLKSQVGIYTNNLPTLRRIHDNLAQKIKFCETDFVLTNQRPEIVQYCQENHLILKSHHLLSSSILNSFRDHPVILTLVKKYNRSVNTLLLNWFLTKQNTFAWIKSTNKAHILENLHSLDFDMEETDKAELDNFEQGMGVRVFSGKLV